MTILTRIEETKWRKLVRDLWPMLYWQVWSEGHPEKFYGGLDAWAHRVKLAKKVEGSSAEDVYRQLRLQLEGITP